jgi:hypothetical protein
MHEIMTAPPLPRSLCWFYMAHKLPVIKRRFMENVKESSLTPHFFNGEVYLLTKGLLMDDPL